jgi:sulfur-carrier protein
MTLGASSPTTITLRYWAAARDAAGTSEEQVAAATLEEALAAARDRHGPRLAAVLDVASLLVDGVRVTPEQHLQLADGTVVEVLPPFAGG